VPPNGGRHCALPSPPPCPPVRASSTENTLFAKSTNGQNALHRARLALGEWLFYSATKFAVRAVTQAAAKEFAKPAEGMGEA
jgi:hypothetical protein